jgi:putative ATP-dependent endonuclease of the OLD family
MRISRLIIKNLRGIQAANVLLPKHGVLIGDNNTGKTTLLEAIDLVLGPDRLNRTPPIDEHDFFQGKYVAPSAMVEASVTGQPAVAASGTEAATDDAGADAQAVEHGGTVPPRIEVEVNIADLTEEQKGRFGDYTEFWDTATNTFYDEPNPAGVDAASITEALRVTFRGWYDPEEDDFEGKTYFTRSLSEGNSPVGFSKKDKQICGFLYLRSLRTGSRALSLERGSLLDIILRLKEVRPQMWEDTIATLADYSVASDPELGISGVLESINTALKKYVPKEWGIEPQLKVSNLTREHLRKVVTAFIATGDGKPRGAVLPTGHGHNQHARLGDAVPDGGRQAKRHLCDGRAGDGYSALRPEANRPRNPQIGFADPVHLPFAICARGVCAR